MGWLSNMMRLPNLMTLSRLAALPILLYSGFSKNVVLFLVMFMYDRIVDVLDGTAARYLHQSSDFGARLDGMVDELFAYCFSGCLILFRPDLLLNNLHWAALVFLLNAARLLIIYIKFHNITRLHLLTGKLVGLAVAASGIGIVAFRLDWMLYLIVASVTVNMAEEIIITLTRDKISSEIRSVFDS